MAAYGHGLMYDIRGNPAAAAEAYLHAIELDPTRISPYSRAVAAHAELRRKGEESGVPRRLETVAALVAGESEPLRWIARIHADEGRHEAAAEAYARALRIHPNRVRLHVERLLHLIRIGQTDVLPIAFRDAFAHTRGAPDLAVPAAEWLRAAHAEKNAPDRMRALRALDQLRKAPDLPAEILVTIAQAYRDAGEDESARRAFKQARDADPQRAETYLVWAFSYMAEGAYAPARAILSEGSRAAAQPMDLLHLLVEVALRHSVRLDEDQQTDNAVAARKEAIDAAHRLLASIPNDAHARMRLADLLILAGQPEEAVGVLRRLSIRDPEIRPHLLRRYLAADASDEAITLMETLADEASLDTVELATLSDLLAQQREFDRAIGVLREAIRSGPTDDPDLRMRLAVLLAEEDRSEEAMTVVRDAIETMGEHAGLLELGTHILLDQAGFEEALEWIDRLDRAAAQDDAPRPHHTVYRALARQYTGQPETAAELLAGAMNADASLLERFVHFAYRLDRESAEEKNTLATLAALERREPENAQVLLHQGLYHHLAGRYDHAADRYETAQRAEQKDADGSGILSAHFFFLFGAASERSGRDTHAMDLLAEAIRLDPNHADALNYLAYMWSERAMNLGQAVDYVRRALEFDPDNAAYIDTLGWIYFQQGRYTDAKIELLRALEKMPDDPTIADHVGDVMRRLDRSDEAIAHWKRALENTPENPDKIREKLRRKGVDLPDEKTPSDAVPPTPGGADS